MKTKIKKLLAMVMCLVVLAGVCAAGVACDTNKETEAEYKARIKKELDEIPVEATGYKLVLREQSEKLPYNEVMLLDSAGPTVLKEQFDNHLYNITVYNGDKKQSEKYGMEISVDVGEKKNISFNYSEKFTAFGAVERIAFYDGNILIVRCKEYVRWINDVTDFFPATLFIYNYEDNTLKYMGYYDDWFSYPIYDRTKHDTKIINTETNEEEI